MKRLHDMKRRHNLLICSAAAALLLAAAGCAEKHTEAPLHAEVLLRTTAGDIRLALDDRTPQHRDNFLKLTREGFFDSVLFHRVIADFMIQAGDPDSRHAGAGALLGEADAGYTLPAEFRFPELAHTRGALAAAREGDFSNPRRESSGSQFYIVWGRQFDDEQLDLLRQRMPAGFEWPDSLRRLYTTLGGTPHLDGAYTVFGHVVEGLEVVEAIQGVETDANDRPAEDVRILRAEIVTPQP